jgi:hypothetical protein
MKLQLSMLTLAVGLSFAQPQTQPPATPPQSTTPTTPQTATQPDTKTTPGNQSANAAPAEMKTTSFKGVLVDLACGSNSSASTSSTNTASQTSDSSKTADNSKTADTSKSADASNTANRSSADSSCPVTANSTQLGMKLDDGKVVRFDLVGNQRAQDALKNDKHWSKDVAANKEIHARVSGVLNGDKLIVSSIH